MKHEAVMTFYDAFCGKGNIRKGLESAGFECVGACEINDDARAIYHKDFHTIPERDIRQVGNIAGADLLAGGVPCQDFSNAGKRLGIEGERSGLWSEFYRLIDTCRPEWVLLENVTGMFARGFGTILRNLAESGYSAEWDCLPACAFGAPHQRDRVWLVANTYKGRLRSKQIRVNGSSLTSWLRHGGKTYWQETKPPIYGLDDGFPRGSFGFIGESVVPQVVEWIGRRIMQVEEIGEVE